MWSRFAYLRMVPQYGQRYLRFTSSSSPYDSGEIWRGVTKNLPQRGRGTPRRRRMNRSQAAWRFPRDGAGERRGKVRTGAGRRSLGAAAQTEHNRSILPLSRLA
jgi:hypothetical protein